MCHILLTEPKMLSRGGHEPMVVMAQCRMFQGGERGPPRTIGRQTSRQPREAALLLQTQRVLEPHLPTLLFLEQERRSAPIHGLLRTGCQMMIYHLLVLQGAGCWTKSTRG